MAVITISRLKGSLGTEIAKALASQLQYDYLDKEGIEKALTARGLTVSEVLKFDEKKQPFWVNWQTQGRKFLNATKTVIYEAARKGNVVIIGRGGQVLLRGIPGVLNVRVIAPVEDRVQRLTTRGEGDGKEALRILKQHDQDSGGFIRAFFDADWEDADLYDLTINTRYLPVDVAVDMILRAISSVDAMKNGKTASERLNELIVQGKVETVLLNLNLKNIIVEVTGGVVTLRGSAFSDNEIRGYEKLVSGIEGVKKVNSNIAILTPTGFRGHY